MRTRLTAASEFESAFRDFTARGEVLENTQILANASIDNAEIAQQTYNFLEEQTERRYNDALEALNLAQVNFQNLQLDMPATQKTFQDGIEAWKKRQMITAIGEALIAVTVVVGSIAAAVVFPPAAAGAIVGAGAVVPAVEAAGK